MLNFAKFCGIILDKKTRDGKITIKILLGDE